MMNSEIMNGMVIIGTLICFIFFLGIVIRAYSKRQRSAYAEAAHLPFDLPDEFTVTKTGYGHQSLTQPVRR